MIRENVPFANLTEKELQKIIEAEKFLNSQPDHEMDREEGKEIVLLAYMLDKG
ncbi:MAG: hypothetical protein GX263_00925 [Firmicutes bacterium]|mgnify:CR=1 FL=1|jgi:hypothetical protein|nr:hypothetical protein [Bacillota bacterium]